MKVTKNNSSVKSRPFLKRLFYFAVKLAVVGLVLSLIPLAYLDVTIQSKFEGRRWSVPAKVYARPLELYPDAAILMTDLLAELNELGYRSAENADKPGTYQQSGETLKLHTRGFQFWDSVESPQQVILKISDGKIIALTNQSSGEALALVRLEPMVIGGIFPSHNEDRDLVKLADVPKSVIDVLIAVEDRSFYSHHGISPRGFSRAMWTNLKTLSLKQGGSTITQQLVKNFYLTNERSVTRKLIEMPMAVLLELHYSKEEILETYLNEVYLGQSGNRAIHGFGLASHFYFGQPLNELELHQIAMLVGIVKGPSFYDPRKFPERVLKRRNVVLDVLAEQGIITPEIASENKQKPLDVIVSKIVGKSRYPAYLDLVKLQLKNDYAEEDLTSEGLRIFTNFDPMVQAKAEESVTTTLKKLEERYKLDQDTLQAAVMVTNVNTGEVQAMVGDRNPRFDGFNRALDAKRQIGSLMKPVVYLTALQSKRYSLLTALDDTPFTLRNPNGSYWQPKNYDHQNHGNVPLHLALAKSYNVATVRLGVDVGIENVVLMLKSLGIDEQIDPYPSVLLGAIDLSPFAVTTMYQTIANDGFRMPLRAIREVLTADGKPLTRYPYHVEEAVDSGAVFALHFAMQEVMRVGTGQSAYQSLPQDFIVAGKTGTTNDSRDSWFAGFTGDRLGVVWVGRDDNSQTPLSGGSGALRIWTKLFSEIHHKAPLDHGMPESIRYQWVSNEFQAMTDANCFDAKYLPFVIGTEPTQTVDCNGNVVAEKSKSNWFEGWFN